MKRLSGSKIALLMDFENLIIGMETNDPTAEKPFSISSVIRYIENNYGQVVYRKAFADWSNSKFRKYGLDLQRAGVDMQHVVRGGINLKNAADTYLVIDAMDCVLHYTNIDTYVIVTGDSDFLPLIIKLKAKGKRIIGLGTRGTIANTLVQNCDEYIYYSAEGLNPEVNDALDTAPIIRALKKILSGGKVNLSRIHKLLNREVPGFMPEYYGCPDIETLLSNVLVNFVSIQEVDNRKVVTWIGPREESHDEDELSFKDYMFATRWFIRDSRVRDHVLSVIFEELSKDDVSKMTVGELREIADPENKIEDKEWYGTLFSLTYGGCLWDDPATSENPLLTRKVSLYRGVRKKDEFIVRYYFSLLHKAHAERDELSAEECAELLYPENPKPWYNRFEEVLHRLSHRNS